MSEHTSYGWVWPDVGTIESARKARMWGFWAAIAEGVITGALTVWLHQTGSDYLGFTSNAYSILSIPIALGIAFGIYKESRAAAVIGLGWYVAGQIPMILAAPDHISKFSAIVTLAFVLAHIASIRANFSVHRLRHSEIPNPAAIEVDDPMSSAKNSSPVAHVESGQTGHAPGGGTIHNKSGLIIACVILAAVAAMVLYAFGQGQGGSAPLKEPLSPTSKIQFSPAELEVLLDLNYGEFTTQKLDAAKAFAEKGNVKFQIQLGEFYLSGKQAPINFVEAEKYFRMAAVSGDRNAQWYLADLLAKSNTTMREAIDWYLKSAKQGNIAAQSELGFRYKDGRGVKRNLLEAYVWFSMAEAKGENINGRMRYQLETQLSSRQIAEAQTRTKELFAGIPATP